MTASSNPLYSGKPLQDKAALVLGASRGIGAAIARAFITSGARVMLGARDIKLLHKVAADLDATGERAGVVQMDMLDAASIASAVAATVAAFGRLDIAVNNAGIQLPRQRLIDIAEEDFERLLNVNLRGVFTAMKHEIQAMLATGGGSIVNLASTAGLVGMPFISPYVASKHAVIGLSKSAAIEYATQGIRVNVLAPGTTMTDMLKRGPAATPESLAALLTRVPMGRTASADEVAGSAVWLCSDAASYVTGIALPVDGGYFAS